MAVPSNSAPPPAQAKDPRSFRHSTSPYMQSAATPPSRSPSSSSQSPTATQSTNGRASVTPTSLLRRADLPPVPLSAPATLSTRHSPSNSSNSGKESSALQDKGRRESPPLRIRQPGRIQSGSQQRESSSTDSGRGNQSLESESREQPRRFASRTSSLVPRLTSTPPPTSPADPSTNAPSPQFAFRPSTPVSVLDRPRPLTPDASNRSSPSRSDDAAKETPRSLNPVRPPNSTRSSARSIPRYPTPPSIIVPPIDDTPREVRLNQSTGSSRSKLSAPGFGSILDRPRPKTPDSTANFDASSRPSTSHSSYSARSIPNNSSLAHQPRPSLTTSVSSHSSMSYESAASGGGSGNTLLSLDLGIDDSNVFDLESFLSVGVSPVKKDTRPIPARLDLSGTGASSTNRGMTPEGSDVSRWRETVSPGRTFVDDEEDESKTPNASTFPDDVRDLTPLQHPKPLPANINVPSPSAQPFVFPSPVGTPESDTSFEPLPLEARPAATSPTRSSRHNSYSNASPHRNSTSSSTTSHYYDPISPADPSPVKRSLDSSDKSLPPTPSSSVARQVPLGPYVAYDPPPASTKPSVIRRGLSKMMSSQGSISSTRSSSSEGHQSGFQVLSATSTKRTPVVPRARDSSITSTKSDQSATTISAAGKRFADRFAASDRASGSFAERDEAPVPPKIPRRKSTLSGLLSGSESLGMSLLGARKSETLLKKESGGLGESEMAEGRRSFELHIQKPPPAARRASTDNLLDIASARLTEFHHREAADLFPPISASSIQTFAPLDPSEKASFVTATRITRAEPSTPTRTSTKSQNNSPGFVGRNTATPVLVRSESILTEDSPNGASPGWRKRVKVPDSGVGSDCSLSSVWIDLEDALVSYSSAVNSDQPDRGTILTGILLPFLRREEEAEPVQTDEALAKRQRQVLFGWATILTNELRELQPVHRGACLEALAGIAESRFMSSATLWNDPAGQALYRTAIVEIIGFAVEKLNDKAVYANTLVFSGRVLALAFFRIEGVAFKLLRALPTVKRQCVKRILAEANVDDKNLPPVNVKLFPAHLERLCLQDLRTYTALLMPITPKPETEDDHYLVRGGDVEVEMSGNWLIRWTASDSDLPFAFYRAYHRQLAAYLVTPAERLSINPSSPLPPSAVICAPGFLFLAASLLDKCDSLVHRNLRSVTSIGPNNGANFNTNDSANLAIGQKPKVLELANRRLVSTMLDIVGGPPPGPTNASTTDGSAGATTNGGTNAASNDTAPDADIRGHAFSGVLQVWIRATVKKTSMWDTRSVFILLDLIEGLIYTLSYPAPPARGSGNEPIVVPQPKESCLAMFDIGFIFEFVKIILTQADNTVCIMRTIAFVYAHFEIFTLRPADRHALCETIILDEKLFPRLYLHWNAGVRGYFIRLLVWRLARIGIVASENRPTQQKDPAVVSLFGLLNIRLEVIRRRHDELEPKALLTDDDLFVKKRSTICSTRGVNEAPFVVDELVGRLDEDEEPEFEAQEVVGTVVASPARRGSGGGGGVQKETVTIARVVSWIKGGFGKSKNPTKAKSITKITLPIDEMTSDQALSMLITPNSSPPLGASPSNSPWNFDSMTPSKSNDSNLSSTASSDHESRRPESPAFFSFEFEGGVPVLPSPTILTTSASDSSIHSTASSDTVFPPSPTPRRTVEGLPPRPLSGITPRVSLRFSKRSSILPPAALDVLKENGQPVPPIPDKYRLSMLSTGYAKILHPYAIRGLRDYEDALDEWEDWKIRLQQEEDEGQTQNIGFVDAVPRLQISWPSVFDSD